MASKRLINGGGDQSIDSIFASSSTNSFLGSRAMVSFGGFGGVKGSGSSFFIQDDNVDEYLDEFLNQPEKKRRLTMDQVQFLEKSFEADTKLEPDRKIQLAKELGLQPRQIGIWFQNRRARWKTKNLEMDYEELFANYESLKTNYDILLKENEKLKAQVLYVKQNGVSIDMEKANKANISDMISENEESNVLAKGDVIYKDDTEANNGIHSCLSDSRDMSAEVDLAQYRETTYDMNEVFWQTGFVFPKMQDVYCHPPANYCNNGFSDHAFSF